MIKWIIGITFLIWNCIGCATVVWLLNEYARDLNCQVRDLFTMKNLSNHDKDMICGIVIGGYFLWLAIPIGFAKEWFYNWKNHTNKEKV